MNDRALHTLEFDKIRDKLSTYASSERGKALCLDLLPLGSPAEVELAQT